MKLVHLFLMLGLLLALPGCDVAVEGDEAGECDDGVDNDQDGSADCDDDGCSAATACTGDDDDLCVDGLNSAIRMTYEVPGPNCTSGGQKIETGLDDDASGFLDESEVETTAFICDGVPAACPEGFTAINSMYCIETDESEADSTWFDAVAECGDKNARLCETYEWYYACDLTDRGDISLDNMVGNWELIGDFTNDMGKPEIMGQTGCSDIDSLSVDINQETALHRCCFTR